MKKIWEDGGSDGEKGGQSRNKQRVRYCKGLVNENEVAETRI